MSLIATDKLEVTLGGHTILRDVSFHVERGDFITIVGPNGAGKSTLLHSLIGLVEPTGGTISKQPNLRIGFVPQRLQLDAMMPITVSRFMQLNCTASRQTIDTIIVETQTQDLVEKPLYRLSGGELQRVMLARALMREPDILILDEPAQNLDISAQLKLYAMLDKIYKERQLTILMVSHDLHMVMASTQKVLCLFHHICCSGTPEVVAKDPEFTRLFGDDMARLMAIYHHEHDHSHDHHHEECAHD